MHDATDYDLIIIGGGPAGLSAAIYAAKQKLNFLLISPDLGGRANLIEEIKGLPAIPYISGFGFIRTLIDQLESYKVPIISGQFVSRLKVKGEIFEIATEKASYRAKTLIIATGRRFKKLGLPGEEHFEGNGVSHCALCDGTNYPNKIVAIIGGGHSGVFSALFMANLAKKVFIIDKHPNLDHITPVKTAAEELESKPNVEIIPDSEAIEIVGSGEVTALKYKQYGEEKAISVDGVFVQVGYDANTEFLGGLVGLNSKREIIIDKNNMTNVTGLFAAGDVTEVPEKQVVVSLGEGAKASLSVIKYLEKMQTIR